MPVLPEMAINQPGNSAIVLASCLVYYDLSSPCSLEHKQKVPVGSHCLVVFWSHCDYVRLGHLELMTLHLELRVEAP